MVEDDSITDAAKKNELRRFRDTTTDLLDSQDFVEGEVANMQDRWDGTRLAYPHRFGTGFRPVSDQFSYAQSTSQCPVGSVESMCHVRYTVMLDLRSVLSDLRGVCTCLDRNSGKNLPVPVPTVLHVRNFARISWKAKLRTCRTVGTGTGRFFPNGSQEVSKSVRINTTYHSESMGACSVHVTP